jgi:hypothetical protein
MLMWETQPFGDGFYHPQKWWWPGDGFCNWVCQITAGKRCTSPGLLNHVDPTGTRQRTVKEESLEFISSAEAQHLLGLPWDLATLVHHWCSSYFIHRIVTMECG